MVSPPRIFSAKVFIAGLFRRAVVVERVAVVSHRGYSHGGAYRGALHAPEAARGPPPRPLRARHLQTALPGRAQPILVRPRDVVAAPTHPRPQPDRRPREALDLPLLPRQECVSAALQGHLEHEPPRGAPPKIHDDRVHACPAGGRAPHLPLRRRYLSRRRRHQGPARRAHRQPEPAPPVRPGGPRHLWDYGASRRSRRPHPHRR